MLEKCTIRRAAQQILNRFGLIPWILEVIKSPDQLHEYTLECLSAILMNLVLHSEGRKICEAPQLETIKVLSNLLEIENTQIRTNINGTLYSLLNSKALREDAKVYYTIVIINLEYWIVFYFNFHTKDI